MKREKLKQITIKAWKEDCAENDRLEGEFKEFNVHDQLDFRGQKIIGFECNKDKLKNNINCMLIFESGKKYNLTINKSVSYWNEVTL